MPRNGYSSLGDLRVTTDGTDLNTLWAEFQQTLQLLNDNRDTLTNLLTSPTTDRVVNYDRSGGGQFHFEEATEFGVPTSGRLETDILKMGIPFKWYDNRKAYTWMYLAEASGDEVASIHSANLEADNRLLFGRIMSRLFTKTTIATRPTNEDGIPVYALYDGQSDSQPPPYAGISFAAGHDHYTTAAAVTGNAIEALIKNVTEHGHGSDAGDQLLLIAHPDTAKLIAGIRATDNDGAVPPVSTSNTDFVPAADAPAFISAETITGTRAPGQFAGLKVLGSFGEAYVAQHSHIPAGYILAVASGGSDSASNPLVLRQHRNAALQGLRLLPGDPNSYPLIDAYYVRAFGVGTKNRGAAAVLQITGGAYASPFIPA